MRRWFAILLLVLLPLQFSWAAVASYCGHERDAQAQHLGHHAHEHHADAVADPGADGSAGQSGKALGSNDLDCGQCHGCCAGIALPAGGLPRVLPASHPVAPAEAIARTLAPSPPERPQWAALA